MADKKTASEKEAAAQPEENTQPEAAAENSQESQAEAEPAAQEEAPAETATAETESETVPAEEPTDIDSLTQGEKMLSAIGYISFLCILPLVLKPKSKFCQFHGKQAMMVLIIFLLFSWLGWFNVFFKIIINLAHLAVALVGAIMAFQGRKFSIPVIGDMSKKIKFD